MGLPVKLAVCFLVLGLMVPVVMETVQDAEEDMSSFELREEAERLRDSVQKAYYGNVTVTHEAHIPSGQWIEVPVESGRGHVLRLFVDGEHVESLSLGSACIIGDPAVISGDCIVELSGTVYPDGAYGVEVTV